MPEQIRYDRAEGAILIVFVLLFRQILERLLKFKLPLCAPVACDRLEGLQFDVNMSITTRTIKASTEKKYYAFSASCKTTSLAYVCFE